MLYFLFYLSDQSGVRGTDCYPASKLSQPSAEMWFSSCLWINELIKDRRVKEGGKKQTEQKSERQAVAG